MRFYTRYIHTFVRITRTEIFFVTLGKKIPFFLKFIPLPTDYSVSENRIVCRDHTFFHLRLHDYMQWHIFAQQSDISWRIALQQLTESACVLDIGANCGAFSLKLAQAAIRNKISNCVIYAFEPNPVVCQYFDRNLSLNPKILPAVHLQRIGLGDKNEKLQIVFSEKNTGGGRIIKNRQGTGFSVEIQTLDSFAQMHNLKNIVFIKIDVEGFEPLVLEGAMKTIEYHKPVIFVEITDSWFKERNSSEDFFVNYFLNEGYKLWMEVDNQIMKYSPLEAKKMWQYNLLAMPDRLTSVKHRK